MRPGATAPLPVPGDAVVEPIEETEAVIPRSVLVGIGVGTRFMNGWLLVVIQREQVVNKYPLVVVVYLFAVIAQHLHTANA